MDEAATTDISKSLAPLREVVGSLSRAARGEIPTGSQRRRVVRRARIAGVAAVPALLRALSSSNSSEASWALYLLSRIGGPRVIGKLTALLREPGIDDGLKGRIIGVLSDLKAPPADRVLLEDPEAMLETSVRDLLASLDCRAEMAKAVEMILEQVPHKEIASFVTGVLDQGGARAGALVTALVSDPRLPSALVRQLDELARSAPPRAGRDGKLLERALNQLQDGKPQRARKWLDTMVVNHPDDAEVRSAFGICLMELNLPDAAIPHLTRAVALQPQVALHRWNLAAAARAAEQMGVCYGALKDYLDSHDRDPAAAERRQEARRFCSAYEGMLQAAYPGVPLELVLRGEELFADAYAALTQSRYHDASRRFREVLHLVPRHYPSWGNLGAAYLALHRKEDAVRCLRRALELNPNYAIARDNLALALG